jgi:peptide/nickel transport system permease protein
MRLPPKIAARVRRDALTDDATLLHSRALTADSAGLTAESGVLTVDGGALAADSTSAPLRRYFRALRTPAGFIGALSILIVTGAGLLGPFFTASATAQVYSSLLAPSLHHPLGTDEFGRDLLARVLAGIRVDIVVCFIGVILGAAVGSILGSFSAMYLKAESVITRLFDIILAFPALLLGLVIAAILHPGLNAITLTIIISNVPLFGRLGRTAVKQQLGREYVLAARLTGGSTLHVLRRHVFPNAVDPLVVQFALSMSTAVFIEGGMSFVGIGVQLPKPSLGNLLNSSLPYLYNRATYAIGPIVVVTMLMVGLYLLSDSFNRELLRR